MPDLVIINPGGQHGIYGPLADNLTALEPPTWARMIAGFIRDKGFSVEIIDAEAENLSPSEVATRIDPRTKLCAIVVAGHQPSASTQAMPNASRIAEAIKINHGFTIKIIMTGNHLSALPQQSLEDELFVDYVCDGE